MPSSVVQTERYLVLDLGHVFTRAFLFDVVDGRYQCVTIGTALSTWEAPVNDVRESVLAAVEALEALTGLRLLQEGEILTPVQVTGEGVDSVHLLVSAGPPMRIALIGILENLSLRSALRAVEPYPVEPVLRFHVNDGLSDVERVEQLLNAAPDVILFTGGTDEGARQALLGFLQVLEMAAPLFPQEDRPLVLYAGNRMVAHRVQQHLQAAYEVYVADNVRPSLERENLVGVRRALQEIYKEHLVRRLPGLEGLLNVVRTFEPVPLAWHRMVRLMSAYHHLSGYLGLHLGSGLSMVARGRDALQGRIRPFARGVGHGLSKALSQVDVEQLKGWVASFEGLEEALLYKAVYPEVLPETEADAWWERGLAYQVGKQVLEQGLGRGDRRWWRRRGLPPVYRALFLGGGVWSTLNHPEALLLTALDLLQPLGTVTLFVDGSHLLAPLGLLAKVNPFVPVQMLRSPHLLPLATVVVPWGSPMRGRNPILRVRLSWGRNQHLSVSVLPGELRVLPLPPGYRGELVVEPLGAYDVGAGRGRTLKQTVLGGWKGVVIDARGRPVVYPEDPESHWQARARWLDVLKREEV